jgi:hypothetical protein
LIVYPSDNFPPLFGHFQGAFVLERRIANLLFASFIRHPIQSISFIPFFMNAFYRSVRSLFSRNRLPMAVVLACFTALSAMAQTTNTWDGSSNSDWHTPGNWSLSHVPLATEDVIIANVTPYPSISSTAVANSVQVSPQSSLTITSSGSLTINGSSSDRAFYNSSGKVYNYGQLIIGNTDSSGGHGLDNRGEFNNYAGASIRIDRSTGTGLYNTAASFYNSGTIVIGADASTSMSQSGIYTTATFDNNAGGIIQIDRSTGTGFTNANGIAENFGTINIGAWQQWGLLAI